MMDQEEKLYHNLNNHIRSVFDNYEDNTTDEGWALLRQKFPEKKKDRGVIWFWYAAAAIVLLGIGLWFTLQPAAMKNALVKNRPVNPTPAHRQNKSIIYTDSLQTGINSKPIQIAGQQPAAKSIANAHLMQKFKPLPQLKQTTLPLAALVAAQPDPPPSKEAVVPESVKKDSFNVIAKNTAIAATNKISADSVLAKTINKTTQAAITKPEDQAPAAALNKLLAGKKRTDFKPAEKTNTKPVFSLYAATYFNYAKGSNNQINAGAGFSSDFRISNKLKLSTGLAIGQNTLDYSNGEYANLQDGKLYTAGSPALAAINQLSANPGLNASYTAPELKNYTANLIGLDIPINLKYNFNPHRNDTYAAIGLSSGTFINETYVLNYTLAQSNLQNTSHTSFSDFYIAKTLNLSFGTGYPLGKSNRLIIEPFIKYPLGGLGTQQIKFGAGGINLKIKFNP